MISVMDILSEDYLYYDNIINSVNVTPAEEDNFKVEQNDILFVRSSETKEEVGWAKLYRDSTYSLYSGFVIRGKVNQEVSSFFVENSLNFKRRKLIEALANGSTRYNISQQTLNSIELPLPQLEEQNYVSALLEKIDTIITLEQEKIKIFKEVQKKILRNIYSNMDSPVVKNIKLGEYISKSGTLNKEINDNYIVSSVNNKEGFVRQSDQFENTRLDSLDKSTYRIVKPQEFAYNPSRINVGSIGYNNSVETLIVSPLYIVFSLNEGINKEFFNYYTTTEKFLYEVSRNTEGSVRQSLSYESLKNIVIPIPIDYNIQRKFAQYLQSLDHSINNMIDKLEIYKRIKTKLLQDMFV